MVIDWIIGIGIVGMLWKINSELSGLKTEMKHIGAGLADHENRIRNLEQNNGRP